MRRACLALCLALAAGPALAQSIEGTWQVGNGETVTYAQCAEGFCSTIDSGSFAGGSVGAMRPANGRYEGTVRDPESGKTYEGHATVEGNVLTLTGCVAKIFCRSQTWTR
ncbi:DUF2147 domain-containing protein [Aureimonas populi]|uniref:DUF2147 domain-containing protein n=1 Tax=Aureimonas populi TaxID=1701758 RepID=A0ABW5CIF1_9HYPH|nr:DUF2147 domain-containing protein [Aureimonas populi]